MRRFDYVRNSYRDEFSNFPPRSYSRTLPRTSSHALSRFSHKSYHLSYSFGSRENSSMHRRFDYGPRPHHDDRFLRRLGFSGGGSHTHFEPRYLDGSRFFRRGSHPTRPNGEVQSTVKTFSGCMDK
jgi:hypothetical protein